jgi:hypothetical protein
MGCLGSSLFFLLALLGGQFVIGDEYDQKVNEFKSGSILLMLHQYLDGDNVILFVNKVGPFRNPQEVYGYYILPLCRPTQLHESRFEGLGEALQGYELIASPMKFNFKSRQFNFHPPVISVLNRKSGKDRTVFLKV